MPEPPSKPSNLGSIPKVDPHTGDYIGFDPAAGNTSVTGIVVMTRTVDPLREAKFTPDGKAIFRGLKSVSLPRGNPTSALERLKTCESFHLKVKVMESTRMEDKNLNRFTLQGEMDPCISVVDLATLLEARFMNGAKVELSATGKQIVGEIVKEVKGIKAEARAQRERAEKTVRLATDHELKVREMEAALEKDPRIQRNEKMLAELKREQQFLREELRNERAEHLKRIATESLPADFDPNDFPEAEEIATQTIQQWHQTIDDPTHMVTGDFIELSDILTRMLQRMAVKVADRFKPKLEL